MRTLIVLLAALPLLLLAPRPALSQETLGAVRGALSAILGEIEGNLTTAEAIEMNLKDWRGRYENIRAQMTDLDRRYGEANAYCKGTYEHDEYVRRLAYCEAQGAQLDTLRAQLMPALESLRTELEGLKRRDEARGAAYKALQGRLSAALPRLIGLCGEMPVETRGRDCRLPPAPGPRSAPMVAEMNATLAGVFTP